MASNRKELLKKLPKVDLLYKDPKIKPLTNRYPKKLIMEEILYGLPRSVTAA